MSETRAYEPTDVYEELFSDEFGTYWIVKGERTPTARKASDVVKGVDEADDGWEVSIRRARIEWRDGEGWWLTCDAAGPYEVWEVSAR